MREIKKWLIVITITLLICAFAKGQTGPLPADFDPNFGANGAGSVVIQNTAWTEQVAVNSYDEIVVNHLYSISLSKPNGGLRRLINCPFSSCTGLALQSNNFVVVAGVTRNLELGIARFDPNLNTDFSFGTNGLAIYRISNSAYNVPKAIVIQGTQIIIVGNAGVVGDIKQFVAKFNGNGTPDFTFGGLGYTLETIKGLTANSVALQWNNVVVGGLLMDKSGGSFTTITVYADNGFRQPGFNNGNILMQPGFEAVVAVQPDKKIVFTGFLAAQVYRQAVGRLNINGSFDLSFGQGGTVIAPVDDPTFIHSIAIDSMGRIVTVGNWDQFTTIHNFQMLIARYTSKGILDKNFSYTNPQLNPPYGWRVFYFSPPESHLFKGVGFQSNGKMIVGGMIGNASNTYTNLIYRFNGN